MTQVGRYLGFRARRFPAGEPGQGAPLARLWEMARFNAGLALGEQPAFNSIGGRPRSTGWSAGCVVLRPTTGRTLDALATGAPGDQAALHLRTLEAWALSELARRQEPRLPGDA